MLRRYRIENAKIVETADEKAPVLLYANPDEAERRLLVETYQIDEHTLSSALDPDEQARLECESLHDIQLLRELREHVVYDGPREA